MKECRSDWHSILRLEMF